MNRTIKNSLTILILFAVLFLLSFTSTGAEAAAPSSGTWGSLNWTLDSNGTLTISGSGAMDGISNDNIMHFIGMSRRS